MIALDSNIFIYMLEAHPEFGMLAQDLFLALEQTNLDGVASELTFMEVLSLQSLSANQTEKMRTALGSLGIAFRPVTQKILLEAARLRRELQLGALDAIHVASALNEGCAQFITNDRQLLKKKVPDIQLVPLYNIKETTLQRGSNH